MAIAGKNSLIKAPSDPILFTGETFTTTDNQIYIIDDSTKSVFDSYTVITVYEAGVPTTEKYIINRLTGTITFETVDALRGAITADGSFLPLTTVTEAREYSYSIQADDPDITIFGDEWIQRIQGLLDFSGSLSRFTNTDDLFYSHLQAGSIFILEFYSDSSQAYDLRAWVLMGTDENSSSVDGVVENSIDFEGVLDAEKRAISKQKLSYEI